MYTSSHTLYPNNKHQTNSYICCCGFNRERTNDDNPSRSRKEEQSLDGPPLPRSLHNDGPISMGRDDNGLPNVDDETNNIANDHDLNGNSIDFHHEIIGQQIVFSTDSSVEVGDEYRVPMTPSHAVAPLPLSMVYAKQSVRQYDKEEGKTFRRLQQLQAKKNR